MKRMITFLISIFLVLTFSQTEAFIHPGNVEELLPGTYAPLPGGHQRPGNEYELLPTRQKIILLKKEKPNAVSIIISPEDKINGFVIVKKGWTLSGISKVLWGSYGKYKKLAKLNNIENPDLIQIGQKIWFREKIVITPEEKLDLVKTVSKQKMEKVFWRKYKMKLPWNYSRSWVRADLVRLYLTQPTWKIKKLFRKISIKLEWLDMVDIYNTIIERVDDPDKLLLMMALVEQESTYRNIHGEHGEIGPFQIKPRTALCFLGRNGFMHLSKEDVSQTLEDIETNTFVGTGLMDEYLSTCNGDYIKALELYNRGSDKEKYARKIIERYDRFNDEYNEILSQLMKEKEMS